MNVAENDKLTKHRDVYIAFLSEKQVDGAMIMEYQRKQWSAEMVEFGDQNVLRGPAGKLWKLIREFDLGQMDGVQPIENVNADSLWNQVCHFERIWHCKSALFFDKLTYFLPKRKVIEFFFGSLVDFKYVPLEQAKCPEFCAFPRQSSLVS